jgi:hypothetical protein
MRLTLKDYALAYGLPCVAIACVAWLQGWPSSRVTDALAFAALGVFLALAVSQDRLRALAKARAAKDTGEIFK